MNRRSSSESFRLPGIGFRPLITYGASGFYRPVSEPILERHQIPYRYTVTAPTSVNVRAAVEAGLAWRCLANGS